jgi:hypothetical protein
LIIEHGISHEYGERLVDGIIASGAILGRRMGGVVGSWKEDIRGMDSYRALHWYKASFLLL